MKNNAAPKTLSYQPDCKKSTVPKQMPTNIAKAAWELWNSLERLNALLWQTFSDDFIIIDEQMEWKQPEIPDDEVLPF